MVRKFETKTNNLRPSMTNSELARRSLVDLQSKEDEQSVVDLHKRLLTADCGLAHRLHWAGLKRQSDFCVHTRRLHRYNGTEDDDDGVDNLLMLRVVDT
ncbi:unnamed protein product [Ceratitis capitata]|uniref:(Mediterranean fruit fly) hypothetical protein n=1 Tax=Ceratitis capitata TaxID=7213 RepID=A0A811V9K9_CERCA|nr:unnamed protein product [Ceratitis capitata]